jgi:hypothetical protein
MASYHEPANLLFSSLRRFPTSMERAYFISRLNVVSQHVLPERVHWIPLPGSVALSVVVNLRHLRRIHAATIDLDTGETRLDLAKVRWRELDIDRVQVLAQVSHVARPVRRVAELGSLTHSHVTI